MLPPLWAPSLPLPPSMCWQEQGTCRRLCPLHFGVVPSTLTHLHQPGWRLCRWCKHIFVPSAKHVNSRGPFSGSLASRALQSARPRAVSVPPAGCESRAGASTPYWTSRACPRTDLLSGLPPSRRHCAREDSSSTNTCLRHLILALRSFSSHALFPMQLFPRVLLLWVLCPGRGSHPAARARRGSFQPLSGSCGSSPGRAPCFGGDFPRGKQTHLESEPETGTPSGSLQNSVSG